MTGWHGAPEPVVLVAGGRSVNHAILTNGACSERHISVWEPSKLTEHSSFASNFNVMAREPPRHLEDDRGTRDSVWIAFTAGTKPDSSALGEPLWPVDIMLLDCGLSWKPASDRMVSVKRRRKKSTSSWTFSARRWVGG